MVHEWAADGERRTEVRRAGRVIVPSSVMSSTARRQAPARRPRQIDGRFGVAAALQHSARSRPQREDVARAGKPCGTDADRPEPEVAGRSAAEIPVLVPDRVDADGERRSLGLAVVGDHERQLQLGEAIAGQGGADDAAGVSHHERELLRGRRVCRDDQVTLIFALLSVDDDDHLAEGMAAMASSTRDWFMPSPSLRSRSSGSAARRGGPIAPSSRSL